MLLAIRLGDARRNVQGAIPQATAWVLPPPTLEPGMSTPHVPRDLPEAVVANREELRRRSRAERVRPIWLWIGIVTGPLAFAVVRIASIILLAHSCSRAAGTSLLGMSLSQVTAAGITLLGALATIGAGLIAWRVWRRTSLPQDEVTTGNMPRVPFWALGGLLVSAFCLFAIAFTGGLALVLSTDCP